MYLMEPFTKWQAWCDLLLMAYYAPTDIFVRGVRIRAERGCVYMSAEKLAERWQWSRGKVNRFILYLISDGRIVQQKSNVINCISILNYDRYQQSGTTDDTADSTTDSTTDDTTLYINKNNKKKKKNNMHSNECITRARRSDDLARFDEWLKNHCPYIFEHLQPLTDKELQKLKDNYTAQEVADMCTQIENRKDLRKNYTSLYRTLLNWLKRENNGNNRAVNSTAEQRTANAARTIADFIDRSGNEQSSDEDIAALWK